MHGLEKEEEFSVRDICRQKDFSEGFIKIDIENNIIRSTEELKTSVGNYNEKCMPIIGYGYDDLKPYQQCDSVIKCVDNFSDITKYKDKNCRNYLRAVFIEDKMNIAIH